MDISKIVSRLLGTRKTGSMAALRGMIFVALVIVIMDWMVKFSHHWFSGWWIPHRTERPVLMTLTLLLVIMTLVVCYIRSPLATLGAGLVLGGSFANLIDLAVTGVVWDMIPLPGSDIMFNLADACIFTGGVFLTLSVCGLLGEAFMPDGLKNLQRESQQS